MSRNVVEYPFKNLAELFEPDGVQDYFSGTLEDHHHVLSGIFVIDAVPEDVRQLLETAKNVSLYSRFCYRFHQASEIVGYTALELAFKRLCENDSMTDNVPAGLGRLMAYSKKRGWLDNDYFDDVEESTRYGIRRKREKDFDKLIKNSSNPVDEPSMEVSEEDLVDGMAKSVAVDGFNNNRGQTTVFSL